MQVAVDKQTNRFLQKFLWPDLSWFLHTFLVYTIGSLPNSYKFTQQEQKLGLTLCKGTQGSHLDLDY